MNNKRIIYVDESQILGDTALKIRSSALGKEESIKLAQTATASLEDFRGAIGSILFESFSKIQAKDPKIKTKKFYTETIKSVNGCLKNSHKNQSQNALTALLMFVPLLIKFKHLSESEESIIRFSELNLVDDAGKQLPEFDFFTEFYQFIQDTNKQLELSDKTEEKVRFQEELLTWWFYFLKGRLENNLKPEYGKPLQKTDEFILFEQNIFKFAEHTFNSSLFMVKLLPSSKADSFKSVIAKPLSLIYPETSVEIFKAAVENKIDLKGSYYSNEKYYDTDLFKQLTAEKHSRIEEIALNPKIDPQYLLDYFNVNNGKIKKRAYADVVYNTNNSLVNYFKHVPEFRDKIEKSKDINLLVDLLHTAVSVKEDQTIARFSLSDESLEQLKSYFLANPIKSGYSYFPCYRHFFGKSFIVDLLNKLYENLDKLPADKKSSVRYYVNSAAKLWHSDYKNDEFAEFFIKSSKSEVRKMAVCSLNWDNKEEVINLDKMTADERAFLESTVLPFLEGDRAQNIKEWVTVLKLQLFDINSKIRLENKSLESSENVWKALTNEDVKTLFAAKKAESLVKFMDKSIDLTELALTSLVESLKTIKINLIEPYSVREKYLKHIVSIFQSNPNSRRQIIASANPLVLREIINTCQNDCYEELKQLLWTLTSLKDNDVDKVLAQFQWNDEIKSSFFAKHGNISVVRSFCEKQKNISTTNLKYLLQKKENLNSFALNEAWANIYSNLFV